MSFEADISSPMRITLTPFQVSLLEALIDKKIGTPNQRNTVCRILENLRHDHTPKFAVLNKNLLKVIQNNRLKTPNI